ncbi:hypothetical protein GCM10009754_83180 [Amycolatopsis minnesotensis]|uniref:Uncharacterized protein n=1 Tax=Amycolatopsis minnesotensis TaxID=337894 RepID=A0ABP5EAM9_9PSEU
MLAADADRPDLQLPGLAALREHGGGKGWHAKRDSHSATIPRRRDAQTARYSTRES